MVSVVTFILAKCCGIKIDPIGKTKKALNDLRDRWKWLDLNLNRIKETEKNYYRVGDKC